MRLLLVSLIIIIIIIIAIFINQVERSVVITHGRDPRFRASLGPSTCPSLKGCIDPCFWWAPAVGGLLGFSLVSFLDNAALVERYYNLRLFYSAIIRMI